MMVLKSKLPIDNNIVTTLNTLSVHRYHINITYTELSFTISSK